MFDFERLKVYQCIRQLNVQILNFLRSCEELELTKRGVAQPGSAHGWGPCGRRFKSCHPDKRNPEKNYTSHRPSWRDITQ